MEPSYPTRTIVSSFGPIIPARLPATAMSAPQIQFPLRIALKTFSETADFKRCQLMPFTKLKRDEKPIYICRSLRL